MKREALSPSQLHPGSRAFIRHRNPLPFFYISNDSGCNGAYGSPVPLGLGGVLPGLTLNAVDATGAIPPCRFSSSIHQHVLSSLAVTLTCSEAHWVPDFTSAAMTDITGFLPGTELSLLPQSACSVDCWGLSLPGMGRWCLINN